MSPIQNYRFVSRVVASLALSLSLSAAAFASPHSQGLRGAKRYAQNTEATEATPTPIPPAIPNPVVPPVQPLAPMVLPSATPAAAPSATPPATPTPRPRGRASNQSDDDKLTAELRMNCDRHFTGQIQSEVRAACVSAGANYDDFGKALAQSRCRLSYGEEPRLVMTCLIGVSIADDLINKKDDFKAKLQLCNEHYPAHTEIDAFLQESCLIGTHLPELMKTGTKAHFEDCATINPERSFIGPCAVGLSLVQDTASKGVSGQQNQICEKYFDHKLFHLGYRSCLSARGFGPQMPDRLPEAVKACTNVISNSENDNERAACIVGINIYKHLQKRDDLAKTFQKCGDTKVSYEDRDFLACITAASLVDLSDKNAASGGCKEIYKNGKTKGRGSCLNSISQF